MNFEYKHNEEGTHLEACPMNVENFATHTMHMISLLYGVLQGRSKLAAEGYRKSVVFALIADDSPVWEGESATKGADILVMDKTAFQVWREIHENDPAINP